jgi:hypothetical protein
MRSMQCNVEFGYNSTFALGPRKTTENLDLVGLLTPYFPSFGTNLIANKASKVTLLLHLYSYCIAVMVAVTADFVFNRRYLEILA